MKTSRWLEGRIKLRFATAGLAIAAALAVACGGSDTVTPEPDPDPVGGEVQPGVVQTPPAGAEQVTVTLTEWAVQPAPETVPAGQVYFLANNVGQEAHELVVIKTDLAPEALPNEDGRVPEDDVDMVDEIEPFAAGSSASIVLHLEAGSYALICNIVDEGSEHEHGSSHYEQGMRTAFTVS